MTPSRRDANCSPAPRAARRRRALAARRSRRPSAGPGDAPAARRSPPVEVMPGLSHPPPRRAGAPTSRRRGRSYREDPKFLLVHHTASPNNYAERPHAHPHHLPVAHQQRPVEGLARRRVRVLRRPRRRRVGGAGRCARRPGAGRAPPAAARAGRSWSACSATSPACMPTAAAQASPGEGARLARRPLPASTPRRGPTVDVRVPRARSAGRRGAVRHHRHHRPAPRHVVHRRARATRCSPPASPQISAAAGAGAAGRVGQRDEAGSATRTRAP